DEERGDGRKERFPHHPPARWKGWSETVGQQGIHGRPSRPDHHLLVPGGGRGVHRELIFPGRSYIGSSTLTRTISRPLRSKPTAVSSYMGNVSPATVISPIWLPS